MIRGFFFDQSGLNKDFVERDYYLLIIGIDKYEHHRNLHNAVRDA